MRILVLGGDGYLGWPTALHLSDRGHDVAVADSFVRRQYDHELGVQRIIPNEPLHLRTRAWSEVSGRSISAFVGDLTDAEFTYRIVREFHPDTIVHYAEQRSAPYSEIDRKHAVYTQVNNVVGTLNLLYAIAEIDRDIHLVKLGTMGEYGTPDIDIEEGWLEVTHKGRSDRMLYPKRPGSFYHLSKVHDSHNIEFACRTWGLRATDLNQSIVYGQQTPQTARDPRRDRHPRHRGMYPPGLGATRRPGRVPGVQPDDREHVGRRDRQGDLQRLPPACRDRLPRQPARGGRQPLLQGGLHRAHGPRSGAAPPLRHADHLAVRDRRAPQAPRRPGRPAPHRRLAPHRQHPAPRHLRQPGVRPG